MLDFCLTYDSFPRSRPGRGKLCRHQSTAYPKVPGI
jgi:hypothetical protein